MELAKQRLYVLPRGMAVQRKRSFEDSLAAFARTPQNSMIEREFVQNLRTQQFVTLFMTAIDRTGEIVALQPRVTSLTYMADGQRYIPAFATASAANEFAVAQGVGQTMNPVMVSGFELVQLMQQYKVAGALLNPLTHCVPVALAYWQAIMNITEVTAQEADDIKLLSKQLPANVRRGLVRAAANVPGLQTCWATYARAAGESDDLLVVITETAQHMGSLNITDAENLIAALRTVLPDNCDVLLADANDAFGQRVLAQPGTLVCRAKRQAQ